MKAHKHKWRYLGGECPCTVKGCGKYLHPDGSVTNSPASPAKPRQAKKQPARKKNPREGNLAEIERAAQLFRGFRDDEPGKVTKINFQAPRAAALIGDIDGIAYRTHHGGKLVKYLHEFTTRARPQLLASADGKMLLILGGNFTFTDQGIVDGARSKR